MPNFFNDAHVILIVKKKIFFLIWPKSNQTQTVCPKKTAKGQRIVSPGHLPVQYTAPCPGAKGRSRDKLSSQGEAQEMCALLSSRNGTKGDGVIQTTDCSKLRVRQHLVHYNSTKTCVRTRRVALGKKAVVKSG